MPKPDLRNTPTRPVPIRLDSNTQARLIRAAFRMKTTRAGVIRFAILNQLPEIEAGTITIRS